MYRAGATQPKAEGREARRRECRTECRRTSERNFRQEEIARSARPAATSWYFAKACRGALNLIEFKFESATDHFLMQMNTPACRTGGIPWDLFEAGWLPIGIEKVAATNASAPEALAPRIRN